ncbi:MAG: glycosyltransferase [Bacteroidota bacterium]|nr:glycosyltransferase [Bacteroidota bacterium]
MKKAVVHLPSWFPCKTSALSGIFIRKQIEALNSFDDYEHIVLIWHDTADTRLRSPFTFVTSFLNLLKKDEIWEENSVIYYKFHYFKTNEIYFGSNETRLFSRIKKIILKLQKQKKIELIHAHISFPAGFFAERLKRDLLIPYIISEHMSPFPFEHLVYDIQNTIISPVKNSGKIIAVSNDHRNEIKRITGVDPIVIPNVVDEREFHLTESKKNTGSFRFLLIGLLKEQKGIDILLNAVKIIKDRNRRNFTVKIGGSGEIVNSLKLLIHDLKIENYIEWLGEVNREHICDIYADCDSFVSSSRHESFGVAIVEALACGKPVISTRSGGPEDIINETNGILVAKEDPIALAEGMEWMMDHIGKFEPSRIREDYLKKYSREVIATAYLKVYNEII